MTPTRRPGQGPGAVEARRAGSDSPPAAGSISAAGRSPAVGRGPAAGIPAVVAGRTRGAGRGLAAGILAVVAVLSATFPFLIKPEVRERGIGRRHSYSRPGEEAQHPGKAAYR